MTKQSHVKQLLLGLHLFVLSSCTPLLANLAPPQEVITGTGQVEQVERKIKGFQTIELEDGINLSFEQDVNLTTPQLLIQAHENIIPFISTEVQGQTLVIKINNNQRLSSSSTQSVKVKASALVNLKITNQSRANLSNINQNSVKE